MVKLSRKTIMRNLARLGLTIEIFVRAIIATVASQLVAEKLDGLLVILLIIIFIVWTVRPLLGSKK
jgi:hypothetical protein